MIMPSNKEIGQPYTFPRIANPAQASHRQSFSFMKHALKYTMTTGTTQKIAILFLVSVLTQKMQDMHWKFAINMHTTIMLKNILHIFACAHTTERDGESRKCTAYKRCNCFKFWKWWELKLCWLTRKWWQHRPKHQFILKLVQFTFIFAAASSCRVQTSMELGYQMVQYMTQVVRTDNFYKADVNKTVVLHQLSPWFIKQRSSGTEMLVLVLSRTLMTKTTLLLQSAHHVEKQKSVCCETSIQTITKNPKKQCHKTWVDC